MNNQNSQKIQLIALGYILAGLFLILLPLIFTLGWINIKEDMNKYMKDIITSLSPSIGVAILGAGIITLTIERQNIIEREKGLENTKNVLKETAANLINEIKYESKKQLISTLFPLGEGKSFADQFIYITKKHDFIIQNYCLVIDLKEKSSDILEGDITQRYRLKNLSNEKKTYRWVMGIESNRIENLEEGIIKVTIDDKSQSNRIEKSKEGIIKITIDDEDKKADQVIDEHKYRDLVIKNIKENINKRYPGFYLGKMDIDIQKNKSVPV
ncbi:MAG: hypothetical protein QNJ54_16425 [Prochloraceae cyanobacterium]|nr:hypothetical protein [Prochloraceae cyanobacterium]